jgi:shikimate dehydrogenase
MTRRVVLVGQGIGYSASPAVHNAAFAALDLDWRYELRDVGVGELDAVVAELRDGTLAGANVTQPHKQVLASLLDERSPDAERTAAVNTVVRGNGTLVGLNTDLSALAAELAELGPIRAAVILGRGGAARAASAALTDAGASAELVGRDRWAALPALLAEADLLVNATPIGTGQDVSPVAAGLLRAGLAVLDLVYRPSPTRLVREARAVGAVARGGGGMLLRQAALSFTAWTDADAPFDVMRQALRAELGPATDA